jgi:hypothetical protein
MSWARFGFPYTCGNVGEISQGLIIDTERRPRSEGKRVTGPRQVDQSMGYQQCK